MSKRKNHHFVPQFYFRRFSTDGRSICLLQRSAGKTIKQASIKAQASKDWFYGTTGTVEDALGGIEAACSAALHAVAAVRNPADLDEENIELLLAWLCLQRSRTEAARLASQPMHDKFLRLQLEIEIGKDDRLSEDERSELMQSLHAVSSDPVPSQTMEMKIALEHSHMLSDLSPVLLENRTSRPFIFGDAPVVLYNGLYKDVVLRGVLGMDTPGLMVIFPLSPTLCLLLVDGLGYRVKRLQEGRVFIRDLGDVLALNKLQLHAASSCVYFHDFRFAAYVQEIWRQERAFLSAHAGKVVEAPGFDAATGESIGDIVHSFQPQLPYMLRLSFVEHPTFGDDDYKFSTRSGRR